MVILDIVRRSLLSSTSSLRPVSYRFASSVVKASANKDATDKKTASKTGEQETKINRNARIRLLKEKYASNPTPLMEFFDSPENLE